MWANRPSSRLRHRQSFLFFCFLWFQEPDDQPSGSRTGPFRAGPGTSGGTGAENARSGRVCPAVGRGSLPPALSGSGRCVWKLVQFFFLIPLPRAVLSLWTDVDVRGVPAVTISQQGSTGGRATAALSN